MTTGPQLQPNDSGDPSGNDGTAGNSVDKSTVDNSPLIVASPAVEASKIKENAGHDKGIKGLLSWAIDEIVRMWRISRFKVILWSLAAMTCGIFAVTFWLIGIPREEFLNWSGALLFIIVGGYLANIIVSSQKDGSTKRLATIIINGGLALLFGCASLYAMSFTARKIWKDWTLQDGRITPPTPFEKEFIPAAAKDFAHRYLVSAKRDNDPQLDYQIKTKDKWQQWWLTGKSPQDNKHQLIVFQSLEFSQNYRPIKALLSVGEDIFVEEAYAFLRRNADKPPRYSPVSRHVEVTLREGKCYLDFSPKADEHLFLIASVRSKSGSSLPDKVAGFGIQLVPVYSPVE